MLTNQPVIVPEMLVGEMLNSYPPLEETLIEMSPIFMRLKNPVLRRSVENSATLKQVAAVGNVSEEKLVNKLRTAAGYSEIKIESSNNFLETRPEWIREENIKCEYDITPDLENQIHPSLKIKKETANLKNNELFLIQTPFVPAPMLAILERKGFVIYTEKLNENSFRTFVKRRE